MEFSGFSEKLPVFLREVSERNSKLWYEEHKNDFMKYVRDPFYEFISMFASQMRSIDKQIITEPKRCLSRIHKDARYSKGGSLYRDRLWFTFKRPSENWLEIPAFYFEITKDSCSYGMGLYTSTAAAMSDYRDFIMNNPRAFKKAIAPIENDEFLHPEGETYKREKQGSPVGLEKWFNYKNFFITADMPLDFIKSPDLYKTVYDGFEKTKDLYLLLADDVIAARNEKNMANGFLG